jgi:hypothetical protein
VAGPSAAPTAAAFAGPAEPVDFIDAAGPAIPDGAGSQQPVEVAADILAAGQDVAVRLDLAPGVTPTATLRDADPVAGGYDHWTGELAGIPNSLVTVIRSGDAVSAVVSSPAGSYTVTTEDSGEQVLTKVDSTVPDADLTLTAPRPGSRQPTPDAASDGPDPTAALGDQGPTATLGDPNRAIDVLVAYTPQAAADAGGVAAVESLAALSVAVSNDSFAGSGVHLTLNLVGTVATTGTGAGDASSATLSDLTGLTDGSYDDVHAARDAAGADLVSLLAADGGPYCGIAWYPASASYGFSVVAQGCAVANLSFPHELGHNLGASHDRYVSPTGFLPYGFGTVNLADRWRTIMAYNDACEDAGFWCQRIARWSNPDLAYLDSPLGVAVGQSDAADNRTALETTAATVADYRTAGGDITAPAVRMTTPTAAYSLSTSLSASWSATDLDTGVATADVRYQRAAYGAGFGAPVYPAGWQQTAALGVNLSGARGYTYCVSARARDQAGNVSTWSAPRCTAVALDDRALAGSWGWSRVTGASYYAGTATVTSQRGATLMRTGVQAKRIYLVASRCATCGTVGVYWNGVLIKKISLYARTTASKSVIDVTTFPGVRSGTVKIRPLTSGTRVLIDGLVLSRR